MVIEHTTESREVSRALLWFGFLGGAVAWLVHILLAYAVAEFGCVSPFRNIRWMGISGVAWLVLGGTAVTLLTAIAAIFFASRSRRRLRDVGRAVDRDTDYFMALAGLYSSAAFAFIIVVETVPIFFYLKDC